MRDDICTIPVSEAFEENEGCPFCKMREMLKIRISEYVLGAAMMESDVRQMTNKQGFCKDHLEDLMSKKNRLSLALVLNTHLQTIKNNAFKEGIIKQSNKKVIQELEKIDADCFICDKINWGFERFIGTFFKSYKNELEFREILRAQPFVCLNHTKELLGLSQKELDKTVRVSFEKDIKQLCVNYLDELILDLENFTKMFDYRNAHSEDESFVRAKDSIERTFSFLSGVVEN